MVPLPLRNKGTMFRQFIEKVYRRGNGTLDDSKTDVLHRLRINLIIVARDRGNDEMR